MTGPAIPSLPTLPSFPGLPALPALPTTPPTVQQVLQMMGGATSMVPKTIFAEKIKSAKMMNLPIDSLVKQMLAGDNLFNPNIAAILQNPMAAAATAAQSVAGAAATAVTTAIGANAFSTALGTFQTAVTSLQSHVAQLTGLGSGAFNLGDLIGHATTASAMGKALPAFMSLENVIAPILSHGVLGQMRTSIPQLQTAVIASDMTASAAATAVGTFTTYANTLVTNSTNAITGLQVITQQIAQVQAVVSAYATSGSKYAGDPVLNNIMGQIIRPEVKAEVDTMLADLFPPMARPEDPSPVE